MKQRLNLDEWPRKAHFDFFRSFDEPFFGVCVNIDCTRAYARCKEEELSLFVFYLHKATAAANAVEPFRMRIEEEAVYVHERAHASFTATRPDGTFGYAYTDYHEDFGRFREGAEAEIERVRGAEGLTPATSAQNVILFSALPWLKFSSVSHARQSFGASDSLPRISFGKLSEDSDRRKVMPVSVHVHHALVDGYHVGQFVDEFQRLMDFED